MCKGVAAIFEEFRGEIDAGNRLDALEKFQNLILMGLSLRTDFFKHVAMFGGTALRIFHNLPRFSEDLDFTMDTSDPDFSFIPYKEPMQSFFTGVGLEEVQINTKEQGKDVLSVSLVLSTNRSNSLKVKIDIEKSPFEVLPETETLYGSYPYQYPARVCTLSSSFAGKMDAIINRQWGNKRVKGRDWYDFLWYMRKGTDLDICWLEERMRAKGSLESAESLTPELLGEMFEERARSVDVREVLRDVRPFMTDSLEKNSSDTWTADMFVLQKDKLVDAARRFILSHRP